MTDFTGWWPRAEAEAFLDEVTVPLRLACRTPADRPWIVSLWFTYRDGAFHCATSADADLVGYLEADPEVAFEVSTNEPPYKGVRGNGTASVAPDDEKALLSDLLTRYLGGTDSELGRTLLVEDRDEVTIRVEPERVFSWDFTGRMADVDGA